MFQLQRSRWLSASILGLRKRTCTACKYQAMKVEPAALRSIWMPLMNHLVWITRICSSTPGAVYRDTLFLFSCGLLSEARISTIISRIR